MEEPLRYGQQAFEPGLGPAPWKPRQLVVAPVVQAELNNDATRLLVDISPAADTAAAGAAFGVPASPAAPSCSGSPQHSLGASLGSSHMVPTGVSPVVVTGVRSVAPAAARKSKGLASAGSLSSLLSTRTVLESAGSGSPVGPMHTSAAAAAAAAVAAAADTAPPAASGPSFRARIRVGGRLLSRKAAQRELRRLQAVLSAGVAGASSKGGNPGGVSSSLHKAQAHAALQQQHPAASAPIQVPDLPDDPFEALMSGLEDPLGCSYSSISDSPLAGSGGGLCGSHSSATSLSVLGLPDEDWLDPWGRLEDPHWDLLAPGGGLGGPCTGPPPWPVLGDPVSSLGLCDDLELPGLPVVKAEPPLAVCSPAPPLLPGEGWDLAGLGDSSLAVVPNWPAAELPVSPPTTSTAASCQLNLELPAADIAGSWTAPGDVAGETAGDTGAAAAVATGGGMGSKLDAGSSSSLQQCLVSGMSRQGSCNTPQASPAEAAAAGAVSAQAGGLRDAGVRVVNVSLAVKTSSPKKPANFAGQGQVTKPVVGATAASGVTNNATAAAAAPTGGRVTPHLPDLATAKEKLSKLPYDRLLAVAARVAATASSGQPIAVSDLLDDAGMAEGHPAPTAAAGEPCVSAGNSPGCKRPAQEELAGPNRWQQQWRAAPVVALPSNQ
jgi:hypothetical protein